MLITGEPETLTATEIVVVADRLPLVPVTVSVYVPAATVESAAIVATAVWLPWLMVTGCGEKLAVRPLTALPFVSVAAAERLTDPINPPCG
jgi:hypothetical protein